MIICGSLWRIICKVESSDVRCGAVGPDEPHVTTTSWAEDVVLEKQGLGYWGPQMSAAEFEGFLNSQLPCHPKLYRGQLKNGLQYLILPNKVPANRYIFTFSCCNFRSYIGEVSNLYAKSTIKFQTDIIIFFSISLAKPSVHVGMYVVNLLASWPY